MTSTFKGQSQRYGCSVMKNTKECRHVGMKMICMAFVTLLTCNSYSDLLFNREKIFFLLLVIKP